MGYLLVPPAQFQLQIAREELQLEKDMVASRVTVWVIPPGKPPSPAEVLAQVEKNLERVIGEKD